MRTVRIRTFSLHGNMDKMAFSYYILHIGIICAIQFDKKMSTFYYYCCTRREDRHIRFCDTVLGTLIHSMVAHLEPVTSLAVNAHGLYLLSGSHNCSKRLWNLDKKTCVQEIAAHRKKFDESIFDVAFHATKLHISSAGADGLAKYEVYALFW
ncbi:striatin-3-like isoform X2 [Eurosta solidaginis]|uniref:striatin-3-like isoform X2 n=1 Tax=Eurosta solidaginis TaxID=178769 RepID=UPI0035307DD4